MSRLIEPETRRLRLRQWREADRKPFATLCSDPKVMEFLMPVAGRAASDAKIDRWRALISCRGWGLWALEVKETEQFIGFVGLQIPEEPHPFLPCVEIGWRLDATQWGFGYATEAATEALRVGFEILDLREIIASTAIKNSRSRRLMERLGMLQGETFVQPDIPTGHPLALHILYRLSKISQRPLEGC